MKPSFKGCVHVIASCAYAALAAGLSSAARAATVEVLPVAAAVSSAASTEPRILHPTNGGTHTVGSGVVLSWTPVRGATGYYVKLIDRTDGRGRRVFSSSDIDLSVCGLEACSLPADDRFPIVEGKRYVWRVAAFVDGSVSALAYTEFDALADGPSPEPTSAREEIAMAPVAEEAPAVESAAVQSEPVRSELSEGEPAESEPAESEPAQVSREAPSSILPPVANGPGVLPTGRARRSGTTTWFAAPDGDDGHAGTEQAPFRTLARALDAVSAGETIVLRGGVYHERELALSASGHEGAPITITSAEGEAAIIDSSEARFHGAPGDRWELVDGASATYRSRSSDHGDGIFTARVRDSRGQSVLLVPYHDDASKGDARGLADLQSSVQTVSTGARYVGPGIYNDRGRLWIRLEPVAADAVHGKTLPALATTDPNELDVSASSAFSAIELHGSHVRFVDLTVRGALFGVVVRDGSVGASLDRVRFETHSGGMLLREGARDVSVHDTDFVGDFPEHVAFTDMKGGDGQSRPASHWSFRTAGINGAGFDGLEVTGSRFHRVFDGFVLRDASDVRIVGNSGRFIDDMVQLGSDSERVEIAHNAVLGAGPSYSGQGDSDEPGSVWIHGNTIDATLPSLWGKADPGGHLRPLYRGWHGPLPFPAHDYSGIVSGVPWKIYHNTVRYDGSHHSVGANTGLWEQINSTGEPHEVYNNIFVNVGDGYFMRGLDPAVTDQRYDGNLYWQEPGGDGGFVTRAVDGRRSVNFGSLERWRDSSLQDKVETRTGRGWEVDGIEADPLLDDAMRPAPGSPALGSAIPLPAGLPGPTRPWRGALGN